jgi:predicted nucleotidyltransferase
VEAAERLDRERRAYRQALRRTLEHTVTVLASRPEVQRIILFGSYARGRRDLFTDLDLLVVLQSPLDFVTRTAELYRSLPGSVDLDLLAYTPQELERIRQRGLVREILEKGTVLYEKRAT